MAKVKKMSVNTASPEANCSALIWSFRKCPNGDLQILYPGYSQFFDHTVQITAGISRETAEKLQRELNEALQKEDV